MTTIEALNKVAQEEGYSDFNSMMYQMNNTLLLVKIERAMKIFVEQFIDVAQDIIAPATDILPDTYDEDLNKWWELINNFKNIK
ncbi:MAG TPA: hypothetical protein PLG47_04275 [Candidatus Dojkabacteria bacterium]|nr:hypothetical protein [Candidatus Dojkabacteria bacterium]